MKPEQAQERLEEIKRLLFEREKQFRALSEIDAQIAELAGVRSEKKQSTRRTSPRDFAAAFGRA